ncbi:MAG: DUF5103 domain-containing protein [Flavobacteriales bacterium]|nr:DUF5103 domain-containing protein [Flavobacteriales bacterium]
MKLILSICLLWISLVTFSQNIKSKMIFNPQTNDQTPVIQMNEYLIFSFDELSNNLTNYNFTVYHCDRNWNKSDLFQTQYLNGYFSDIIRNRSYSFNTLQKYAHYELQFPNQNIIPKLSGNYKLIIYKDSEEEPVLTYKFSILENLANLFIKPERNNNGNNPDLNQRLNIKATIHGFNLNQVLNSLELITIQNNNWNQNISEIKPQFTSINSVSFNPLDIVFTGGNEFHFFDTKENTINGASTQKIERNDFYEHTLYFDEAFPMNYYYTPDVNGAYYFRKFNLGSERDATTEADYVWVLFGLKSPKLENKDVYVVGMFNDYTISDNYKMQYREDGFYELPLFLKQGYYNYEYATKDNLGNVNYSEIDGSFWQTENLYQAFLYVKPWGFSYDALVGYGEYRQPR